MTSFTQKLDPEALKYFTDLARQPFAKQAVQFLNAYWTEIGDQAEIIFAVFYEVAKMADMHFKGVSLIHLYDEGCDMDYNVGLYFYEKLCLKLLESQEGKVWRENPKFKVSMPEFMTAIVRKQELREKVDVDFDGKVSLLEVLLYQYREFCNPADFCERSMRQEDEHPEITRARLLLEDVNAAIRAYEKEKQRLEEESKLPGVKGLTAKHTFAQLSASPLAEKLSTALIKAEAAVRKANRLFGAGGSQAGEAGSGASSANQSGALFWMTADLEQKKTLYGRRAVAGHAVAGGSTSAAPAPALATASAVAKPLPGKLQIPGNQQTVSPKPLHERFEPVKPKSAPPPLPTAAKTVSPPSPPAKQPPPPPPKAAVAAVAAVAVAAAVVAVAAEEEEEQAAAPVQEEEQQQQEEEAPMQEEEQQQQEEEAHVEEEQQQEEVPVEEEQQQEEIPVEEEQQQEEVPVEEEQQQEEVPVEQEAYQEEEAAAPVEEEVYQEEEAAPLEEEQQVYEEDAAAQESPFEEITQEDAAPPAEEESAAAAPIVTPPRAQSDDEDDEAWNSD